MKLAELIHGTSPAQVATLTLATPATHGPTVATVATVTVANGQSDEGDAARFRARWREAALASGFLADAIERLPAAELELYRQHFADCPDWNAAAQAAASMLADGATRRAGRVPPGDTAVIACRGCGLVYVHPSLAAVLPVVDGWPRALGCPWCFVRAAGLPVPHPHGSGALPTN